MTAYGAMNANATLSELRGLVHAPQTVLNFAKLCRRVQRLEEEQPGAYASEGYQSYLEEHMARWHPQRSVLHLQQYQCERLQHQPWLGLAQGFVLHGTTIERLNTALGYLPRPPRHLALQNLRLKKKTFLEAMDAGVFDHIPSLQLDACPLRFATFEPVLRRLERLEALEELRLNQCTLGAQHLDALAASPLAARLKTLGLSGTKSLKSKGMERLAALAPSFERLERLELASTGCTNKSLKALAEASWAPSMTHIGLAKNPGLKLSGFKHLAQAGRLGWLVDTLGSETRLDLSEITLNEKLQAFLVDNHLLEGVTHLLLHWSKVTTLNALLTSEHLHTLESLDLSLNNGIDPNAIVALAERAKLRVLDVSIPTALGDAFAEAIFTSPCSAQDRKSVV